MAICQNAVGLGHSVGSRGGHVVSAAKVAGRMIDNSIPNGSGCCGGGNQELVSTVYPGQHSLKGVVEKEKREKFWKNKEVVNVS